MKLFFAAWFFLMFSNSYRGFAAVVGPFKSQSDCEYVRTQVGGGNDQGSFSKQPNVHCWSDGK